MILSIKYDSDQPLPRFLESSNGSQMNFAFILYFVFSISIFVFCISVLILSPLSRGPTVGNDWVLVGSMGPSVTKSRSLLNLPRRKIPRKGQSMDRNIDLKWAKKMVQRDSPSFITRPRSLIAQCTMCIYVTFFGLYESICFSFCLCLRFQFVYPGVYHLV